ncbi:uncharacterized protein [Rutidosis leptorrhynchoides]|uniref:uncharacterized protein n=1 Tax=Rutidosis leptorrhynchoides TaxID=125765 RepID=UPI003A9985B8
MVVGTKAKKKKSKCVQVDCVINVVEIKPWPPSKSLISLRSALIQWEHGDKNSGSTKQVAPSYASGFGVGDGKIEFNESFKIHVTLSRENETFVKNCIEFNLYEPRRDRTVKGQLLGFAVVDLAEYGVVKESLLISVPMSCKRTFGSTTQPMLFVKIKMVERNHRSRSSSSRESLISQGSVSVLMNEEYAEEAETDSSTDNDDIISQSSITADSVMFGSNANPQRQNGSEAIYGSAEKVDGQELSVKNKRAAYEERISSSKDLYSELESARTTLSNIRNSKFTMLSQRVDSQNFKLSRLYVVNDGTNEQSSKLFQLFKETQIGQESQTIEDFGFDVDRLKNAKSVGSLLDSGISNGYLRTTKIVEKLKNVEKKDESKVQQLEQRVQNLEDELREAAGIEISLYSVVAEHGSSINRVHAPSRRLSRLYVHSCKTNSSRRATSAKCIVSGLVSVTKACGNDVPRLTFWLSNCIVLRAIIHKSCEKGNDDITRSSLNESTTSSEWEDPCMITSILERVESWIFSRIIESIWWQTLAPYMQTTSAKGIFRFVDSESNTSRQTTTCNHEQSNTSLHLWKTAFMDACERICPVRSAGRNCGCLSVLSMLIMEQCVSRLDVAMFNAILREPHDEGPTDPVSDPIGDATVLPIPSGKTSFGAGAQLKKTIGNWSSWLTDVCGSPITFHLLTALSELMMMPKDMLLSSTIRKEVCPTFGIPLIKRILDSFVPDEFCPDMIPVVVLEAMASEDLIESSEDCITSLPCAAAPIVYHPPAASLIGCILGDERNQAKLSRSGSSILRKSNTSDDELDELDSPFTSIIDSVADSTKPVWTLKDSNVIRYQLLKDVWMNSD